MSQLTVSAQAGNNNKLGKYYKYTHLAEHFIINNLFDSAVLNYDSAFLYKDLPFSQDMYNRMNCNIQLKCYFAASKDIQTLIRLGAPKQWLSSEIFNDIKGTPVFEQILASFDSLHAIAGKKINDSLVSTINQLISVDQNQHCSLTQNADNDSFLIKMHNIDDHLSDSFLVLMSQHKNLNEQIIGANFYRDTTFSPVPKYGIIALHQFQKGGRKFENIFLTAIANGDLKLDVASMWMSEKYGLLKDRDKYLGSNDTLWRIKQNLIQNNESSNSTSTVSPELYLVHKLSIDDSETEERIVYNYKRYIAHKHGVDIPFVIFPTLTISDIASANPKFRENFLLLYEVYYPQK